MKTILITIPSVVSSHGYLRTDFLDHLLQGDVKVVLIVAGYRAEYHRKQYADRGDIEIVSVPSRHTMFDGFVEKFFRSTIPSRTVGWRQMRAYNSSSSPFVVRVARLAVVRFAWLLGHMRAWRRFLRFLYSLVPVQREYLSIIETYRPDAIFSTTLFDPIDLKLLRAARAKRVRVIGMPKQWDNLSSKCLTPIHPDHLLVQNEHVRDDAITFSDYPAEKITICGVPQFDFHADPTMIIPRDEFLKQRGLGPTARYMLFSGVGPINAPEECVALRESVEALRALPETADLAVVYRPHPNYVPCVTEGMDVIVHASNERLQAGQGGWEFNIDDIRQLVSVLYHADVVTVIGSTIAIEAAIHDRPIIGIAFGGVTHPYWKSPLSYYDSNHFAPVVQTGALRIVESVQALVETVAKYRRDPSLDAENRVRLVREYVYRADGRAAERIAREVRSFLFQSPHA